MVAIMAVLVLRQAVPIPMLSLCFEMLDAVLPQPPVTLGFYRDIAVLAFKSPTAQTGTGKTAAFALPILHKLAADRRPAPKGGARVLFEAGISWALDVGGVFPLHVPAFQAQNGAGESVYRSPSAAGALLSVGPAFTF